MTPPRVALRPSPPPDASPSPSIQYHVLYYKQTRKVHKSKGVSKSDGILSINPHTEKVMLFDQDHEGDHTIQVSSTRRPLHSSRNAALAKRFDNLENEENVPLGGYELDILGKAAGGSGAATEPSSTESQAASQNARVPEPVPPPRRGLISRKRPFAPDIVAQSHSSSSNVVGCTAVRPIPASSSSPPPGAGVNLPPCDASDAIESRLGRPRLNSGATLVRRVPSAQPRRRPIAPGLHPLAPRFASAKGLHQTQTNDEEGTDAGNIESSNSIVTTAHNHHQSVPRRVHSVPLRSKVRPTVAIRHPTPSTRLPPTSMASEPAAADTTTPTALLSHLPLPTRVLRALRPHQVTGIDFLYRALTTTSRNHHGSGDSGSTIGGAILADEPGLGKTLMTIAVIAALHRQQRHQVRKILLAGRVSQGSRYSSSKPSYPHLALVLCSPQHFCVVCPSSLVGNWVKEFDQWLGPEGQPKRVPLKKGDATYNSSSMKSFLCSKTGQVVILSYDLFRLHSHHFSGGSTPKNFALLVVDEGHRLKNTSGSLTLSALEELPTDARLILSATPIQNNLGEFYTLSNFCRPGILGDLSAFRQRFERPILNAATQRHGPPCAAQQELDHITSTFLLRRLQKDVLQSLIPPRTEVLLFCRPTPLQCQYYQEIVAAGAESNDALSALTSLRKVCSHPVLYAPYDDQRNSFRAEHGSTPSDVALSGKLVVLQALLHSVVQAGDSSKVVIVSNFTSALSLVETLLFQPLGYSYVRLDGSTGVDDRQALVDRFNKRDIFCFLLSSKAGGCGLNLVGANRLVLLDPSWNPADDVQAMGRIYRQGQTRSTTVYRFFTSGTVEEVIYQRQLRKGTLAGIIDKRSTHISRDEINDCFTLNAECACATKQKQGPRWPHYVGPESLPDQGCWDAPLLQVCEGASEILRWVHVVRDNAEEICATVQEERYDSANEVEFEFDDECAEPACKAKCSARDLLDSFDGYMSDFDGEVLR